MEQPARPPTSDVIALPPDLPASPADTYRRAGEETAETVAPPRAVDSIWKVDTVVPGSPDVGPRTPSDLEPSAGKSQYQLVRLIGRGGMGEVWEAVQASLGRTLAVKRLSPRRLLGAGTGAHQAEFRQEAMLSARLQHPNIVPVYDLGVDEGGASLLAMKLVQGDSWDTVLERDFERLSPRDFLGAHVPVLVNVAQAVAFAHSRGIVHRDIKPSQVMLGEFGEVLLTDWGLALYYGRQDQTDHLREARQWGLRTRATATNPSGTPALMAPEQTENGAQNIGPWTDVFLLGATLYFILAGSFPFSSTESRESFRRAAAHELERPEKRSPGRHIPVELADLAMEAMALLPEERVPSAQRFVVRLQDYISGAGRRARAEALAASARGLLDRGGAGYSAYSEALAACAEARQLWPECEEAARVARRAHLLHARAALANGDLMLARLQATALGPECPERAQMLEEVDAGEQALAAQARQRALLTRTALGSLAALLVVASLAFLVVRRSLTSVEEALGRETEARALAQESRDESEDLLLFMMAEQYPKLQQVQQLELLLPVVDRAIAYYERRVEQEGELPDAGRLQWAKAIGLRGGLLRSQGRFLEGLELTREALRLSEKPVEPALELAHLDLQASLGTQLAEALGQAGRFDEARVEFGKAIARREQILEAVPGSDLAREGLALALAAFAESFVIHYAQVDDVIEAITEAIAIQEDRLARGTEGEPVETRLQVIQFRSLLSRAQLTRGDVAAARAAVDEAREDLRAVAGMPGASDWDVRVTDLDLRRRDLFLATFEDRFEELPGKGDALVASARELLDERPTDTLLLEVAAACMESSANQHRVLGNWERVVELEAGAGACYARLSAHDQSNYSWRTEHIRALVREAQGRFRLGDREAAQEGLDDALDQADILREQFGTDRRTYTTALDAAGWMVFAATQAGDLERARGALDRGLELLEDYSIPGGPGTAFETAEYNFRMNAARFAMRFLPPEEADKALESVGDYAREAALARAAYVGHYLEATLNRIEHHLRHTSFERAESVAAEATAFLDELQAQLEASEASVRRDIAYGLVFINVMRASGLSISGDTPAALALLMEAGVDDQWLRATQGGNLVQFLDPIRDADPQGYQKVVEANAGQVPGVSYGGTPRETGEPPEEPGVAPAPRSGEPVDPATGDFEAAPGTTP